MHFDKAPTTTITKVECEIYQNRKLPLNLNSRNITRFSHDCGDNLMEKSKPIEYNDYVNMTNTAKFIKKNSDSTKTNLKLFKISAHEDKLIIENDSDEKFKNTIKKSRKNEYNSEICLKKSNNNEESSIVVKVKAQSAPNLATNSSKFLTNFIQKNSITAEKSKKQEEESEKKAKQKIPIDNSKMNGWPVNNHHSIHGMENKNKEEALSKFHQKYFKNCSYKRIQHLSNYSSLWKLITKLAYFILNLLTIFILILALFILLPIKLLKVSTFKILFYCNLLNVNQEAMSNQEAPDGENSYQHQNDIEYMNETDFYPNFLTSMELFWLHDSKFNKSISSYLVVLDGNVNRNFIRELIKNRIIMASSRDGKRLFPRFTQIVKHIWGFGYAWVYANQFSLDEHIEELPSNVTTFEHLQEEMANLTSRDFDRKKPLWKVYYKHNFGAEKGTVLLYIYHTCLSDGVSLIRIFFKTIVDNKLTVDLKPRFSYRNLTFKLIRQMLLGWHRVFYEYVLKRKDLNPLRIPNLNGRKKISWSEPFSFADINRLKLVTRSTFNDLFISVLSGILRTYIKVNFDVNNPGGMNFVMPVDLRSNEYPVKLGIKSTLSIVKAATDIEGCIPRLWHTREVSKEFKASSDYLSIYLLIKIIFYTLPCSIASSMAKHLYDFNSVIASTISASNQSLSSLTIANRNIKSLFYFHPAIANIALSCSIITYGDEVRLSIISDSGVVLNPKFLTDEFNKQLEILKELLANRRIPGEVRRIIKEPVVIRAVVSMHENNYEMNVEEIQAKMTEIQNELQDLTHQYENLDKKSFDFMTEKKRLALQLDSLRKEFHNMLYKMQTKQAQAIPSDDEDELDPQDRFRLRSASIASRTSLNSNNRLQKQKSTSLDPGSEDYRDANSRNLSALNTNSKHCSHSYAAGISNLSVSRIISSKSQSLLWSSDS